MFKCICHAVREGETDRYHLIGTKCGKCLKCPMGNKMLKKFKKPNNYGKTMSFLKRNEPRGGIDADNTTRNMAKISRKDS